MTGGARFTPKVPAPDVPLPAPIEHPSLGPPDLFFMYRNAAGRPLFIQCEWRTEIGARLLRHQLSHGELDGEEGWHWQSWGKRRPLYNLRRLQEQPEIPVIVTNREYYADLADKVLDGRFVVVSCAGPWGMTNWSTLADRTVYIWPSPAPGGDEIADAIAAACHTVGAAEISIIQPPALAEKSGFGLGDALAEEWTVEEFADHIDVGRVTWQPPASSGGAYVAPEDDCPFVPLGHKGGTYFVISPRGEIREISSRNMGDAGLQSLTDSPDDWYRRHFPSTKRDEAYNVRDARAWLMNYCAEAGLFDPARTLVRGVGVWRSPALVSEGAAKIDAPLIVHAGPKLLIDGKWERAGRKIGNAIFPVSPAIAPPADAVATEAEAAILRDGVARWNFVDDWGAVVVIGFIGQAFLAGAIPWRAHGYLLAEYGSGKSWLDRFIAAALGGAAHPLQNNFSSAHLYQAMTGTSLALILDEAEPGDSGGWRLTAVIELIRNMSGSDGARVGRGSAGGHAVSYTLTSAAWLSSIAQARLTPQDRSRITTVRLGKLSKGPEAAEGAAKVEELTRAVAALSPKLWRRVIDGYPRFLENFAAYRSAVLAAGAEPREADQLAPLFAGYDTMLFDDVTEPEAARGRIDEFDGLLMPQEDATEGSEGWECWRKALTSGGDGFRGGERRTVARLIQLGRIPHNQAERRSLESIGMRLDLGKTHAEDTIFIANNHDGLERIFGGGGSDRWAKGGWTTALRYLPGATVPKSPRRFEGVPCRGTLLPAQYLPDPADDEGAVTDSPPTGHPAAGDYSGDPLG